tara:strand:- start:20631 stop:21269 length:639 start_codon:yes stop_codon:yes gene_type:complete
MSRLTKQTKFYNPITLLLHILFYIAQEIISYFYHKNPIVEKEKYENKYLKEYDALEEKEYSENALKMLEGKVVEEYTERHGLIKMTYNVEKSQFIYFTECIKTVPYNILDVIGRKFAITFDCKCIFVDIKEELEKAKTLSIEQKEKQKNKEKKDLDDVFVRYKSYNIKQKADPSIKNKINNYKYGGKIEEMDNESKKPNVKALSFKEFKNNV